jgi:nucleoside-diphosphate-sugar epimerase
MGMAMSAHRQTVLVTGAAGFVGSHLCQRLVALGHRVIGLDNYFTGSREMHVEGVEYRAAHTKDIASIVPETPDLLYHLGEYSRVEISLTEPALVWDLNVAGTFGVLELWTKISCSIRCVTATPHGERTVGGPRYGAAMELSPVWLARASPSHDLSGFQYHPNWLYNLLIAFSLGGLRP